MTEPEIQAYGEAVSALVGRDVKAEFDAKWVGIACTALTDSGELRRVACDGRTPPPAAFMAEQLQTALAASVIVTPA